MLKFTQKVITLSFPIFICFICLEVILRLIPNDYKYKASYLDANASEIETLILGSSHSFFGVNPMSFDKKTFNAGHVSQSLDYDYEILMKYKDNWKSLKTIYLPISYFTMWGRLNEGEESWRCKLYYCSYGIDNNLEISDYFKITDKFSMNIKKSKLFILKNKTQITCNNLGWGTSHKSYKSRDLKKTGVSASRRHTKDNLNSVKYSNIYKENIQYLNEVISWAKNNDIKVVLFTPPAFKTYRDELNSKQLYLTNESANKIANKYDNCVYINLMSDLDFVNTDFYDADHLNEIGAKKLSQKLNKEQAQKYNTTYNIQNSCLTSLL